MKLPVYLYGCPVLREEASDITPDYPKLKELIANMFDTMYGSEGVGLAAPQIGRSDAIIVIDADALAETFPECAGFRRVLINPTLEVLDGDPVSRTEGCLSLPGLNEDVKRVEHIRLTYLDADFNEHTEELAGFPARVVQHEMDHLEGTVFTDRIATIRRQLIRNKLNNIATGRTRCDYPAHYGPATKGRAVR